MSTMHRCSLIAALAFCVAAPARAQQSYPQTLYWGSGLIDVPVAWVSPISGDFALGFSGKTIEGSKVSSGFNFGNGLNTNSALAFSFFGRAEVGLAFYSDNPEWGFFGRALLLDEEHFRGRDGLAGWVPSLAVGLRNVGPYSKIDRFSLGYRMAPGTPTDPSRQHVADALHQNFSTGETVYGVATKSFLLSDLGESMPHIGLSLSLGYGNGLFEDDGGLGDAYAKHSTGGLFGGVKMDVFPSPRSVLSFMAENNAWDYNLGVALDYRGLQAGAYWTEVGAGSSSDAAPFPYNYNKFAFSLGWRSNALALLRGDLLQDRVAELERERETLVAELKTRQTRVASLQLEIERYRAQNVLDLEQRRAQAEQALKAEREALRRIEERLRRLEQSIPPGETPQR
ncbi:MAG TPA: hypothetical protein VFK39_05975 [Gemmatimonadaceae bacterium]|nr:hypothetical protein [Gemmatimonadaceae bacterium]